MPAGFGAGPSRPVAAIPARHVRLVAVGDVTLGSADGWPEGGAASLLAGVRPYLRGDIVLGNLETPLATHGARKCTGRSTSCYAFRAPPEYARALAGAGFTAMSVANNHALDLGTEGQAQTVRALAASDVRITGRPGEISYVTTRNGVRVALIGFAPYSWAASLLDVTAAQRLVRRAAARSAIVVVAMHAGAEGVGSDRVEPGTESYLGENRGDALRFAHAVVDAGADLVVGHGPHVLRGMEWYRGRLIAYSLGNFSGYRTLSVEGPLGVAGLLDVTLSAGGAWRSGRLVPIRLVDGGKPAFDPERTALPAVRELSRADFRARAVRLDSAGRITG